MLCQTRASRREHSCPKAKCPDQGAFTGSNLWGSSSQLETWRMAGTSGQVGHAQGKHRHREKLRADRRWSQLTGSYSQSQRAGRRAEEDRWGGLPHCSSGCPSSRTSSLYHNYGAAGHCVLKRRRGSSALTSPGCWGMAGRHIQKAF